MKSIIFLFPLLSACSMISDANQTIRWSEDDYYNTIQNCTIKSISVLRIPENLRQAICECSVIEISKHKTRKELDTQVLEDPYTVEKFISPIFIKCVNLILFSIQI